MFHYFLSTRLTTLISISIWICTGQSFAGVEVVRDEARKLILNIIPDNIRYKDKEGNWKSSGSFGRNEIPLAVHVLNKAFEAIVGEEQINETVPVEQVE